MPHSSITQRTVLVLVLGAAAACADGTGPEDRILQELGDLDTPAVVGATDTLRIGFSYPAGCGPPPELDVAVRPARIVVSVWRSRAELPRVCPAIFSTGRTEVLILPQFHGEEPIHVVFRQPGGTDSLRTIGADLGASRAP